MNVCDTDSTWCWVVCCLCSFPAVPVLSASFLFWWANRWQCCICKQKYHLMNKMNVVYTIASDCFILKALSYKKRVYKLEAEPYGSWPHECDRWLVLLFAHEPNLRWCTHTLPHLFWPGCPSCRHLRILKCLNWKRPPSPSVPGCPTALVLEIKAKFHAQVKAEN